MITATHMTLNESDMPQNQSYDCSLNRLMHTLVCAV